MDQDDLRLQLERLAKRLDRVEEMLNIRGDVDAPGESDEPSPTAAEQAAQAPPGPAWADKLSEIAAKRRADEITDEPGEPTETVKPSAVSAERRREGPSLEFTIGGRWMAWAGAIIVVIAVAFFVKLAVDEGWFGRLPPLAKCLLAAGFGGLLIAAGEWALRYVGRPAAVGLFGAGIGTLYLTSYATFRFFNLLDESGAFILLALTALFGIMLTVRARMLTIGVLSLTGGYLAPILLSGASTFVTALPTYLTALLAIALALSTWRDRPFRSLRYVALCAHAAVAALWALSEGREHVTVALSFMSLWWLMIAGEAMLTAWRGETATGNTVMSLLSTLWFVTVGCWVLADIDPGGRDWTGLFTLLVALAAATMAYANGPRLEALRAPPQTAIAKLAMALWAQVGVLLAVAIALQFEDYGQSIGWLALALAAVEIGRRLPSGNVAAFGLLVGALALIRVAALDPFLPALRTELCSLGDVSITHWSLLALAAICATHAAAHRIRLERKHLTNSLRAFLSCLSVAGWLGLCVVQCEDLAVPGGWLIAAVLLLGFERLGRAQRYLEAALLVLALTAAHWLINDAILGRLSPGWSPTSTWPLLNAQMAVAAAITAAGWWAARILSLREISTDEPQRHSHDVAWQAVLVCGAVLMLISLSMEVDRAVERVVAGVDVEWSVRHVRQLLLTILWAVGGLGLGMVGRALAGRQRDGQMFGVNLVIRFAWGMLLACAGKWIIIDCVVVGRLMDLERAATVAWPLLNTQMLAGGVVIGALLVFYITSGVAAAVGTAARDEGRSGWLTAAAWLPVAGCLMLLWGLTFELDRAIGRWEASRPEDWSPLWPAFQLRLLWWTALCAVGGLTMFVYGRFRARGPMVSGGVRLLFAMVCVWLVLDTLVERINQGVALVPVVFNLQFAVGALLIVLLVIAIRLARAEVVGAIVPHSVPLAWMLVGMLGLWLGTLELDRLFAPEAGRIQRAAMARHTALSVYWSVYAIVLVALGFTYRSTWCRYAGLALLAFGLAKVLIIDMSEVRYIYRVFSLLGVGLLLVATSVAYGKLAPRLLARPDPPPPGP